MAGGLTGMAGGLTGKAGDFPAPPGGCWIGLRPPPSIRGRADPPPPFPPPLIVSPDFVPDVDRDFRTSREAKGRKQKGGVLPVDKLMLGCASWLSWMPDDKTYLKQSTQELRDTRHDTV